MIEPAERMVIRLTENAARSREVTARRSLADFLRDPMLTGTHVGCEHGVCGACTVFVDGAQRADACLFAVQLDGATVDDHRGPDATRGLEPAPAGLLRDTHAMQCGFCTPAHDRRRATELLEENPAPSAGADPRGAWPASSPHVHGLREHRPRRAVGPRRRRGEPRAGVPREEPAS